mmetsp:Transcript_24549/g.80154  ORF Transcript_24549/g.80154 Transcript_24549/m.80154 type:complete len:161 (+) Transcript_24549:129-611(+)
MAAAALFGPSDATIKAQDAEYMEKHKIKEMLSSLMFTLIEKEPKDPIQFLVDALSLDNPADAEQDAYGLSKYRRARLLDIFRQMDKDKSGFIEFKEIKEHSSKYGGQALSEAELREVFRDFDSTNDHRISEEEFLQFFARSVAHIDNTEFDAMVSDMLDK